MSRADEWWSVSRAAAATNLSIDTVRAMADDGRLVSIRTASNYRLIDPQSAQGLRVFVGVSQAARLLGVSAETVRTHFDDGELWGFRTPAGHRRIDPEAIEAFRRRKAASS